jgi:hypothetical protein
MRSLTLELMRSVSETAGMIADTEDEIARVHEGSGLEPRLPGGRSRAARAR